MVEHTIRAFDKDLHQVGRKIAEMGQLDAKQIDDAIEALIKRDTSLAKGSSQRMIESMSCSGKSRRRS